ncbi:LamG domain-containing protein [Pontiella sulfatireligans]|uniref:Laminin G domain-containing protein n=1 Tax=Pontiella sulfatireligans TaxID=2750658 RepID=A0A6C2UI49_9BACT|nr:LamG domain-containing protein [Pontiella sulfatireligans]VGO19004.1 hypothetical protein SCARR_01058 [Pontiella sulfatireligans]
MNSHLILVSAFVLCSLAAQAGEWQRNTFPGQGHVDHGHPAGAGWDHVQQGLDIAVSPFDPDRQIFLDNEWAMVMTSNGQDFLPLHHPYLGTYEAKARAVKFSRYDPNTIYLLVATRYWKNLPSGYSPAGLWRSQDLGETWQHIYELPSGSYERIVNKTGKNRIVEDPTMVRTNHLYLGTTSDGLLRSTDGGSTWSTLVPELSDRTIKHFEAASTGADETVLYVLADTRRMARHIAGEKVPLDNFENESYTESWEFDTSLKGANKAYDLLGSVDGWEASCAEGSHAARFDGTINNRLTVSGMVYTNAQELLTVSCWLKTTNRTDQVLVSADRNNYFELAVNGEAAGDGLAGWTVMAEDGSTHMLSSTTRVDDGEWHHVTGVWNKGRMRLIVDAEEEAEVWVGGDLGKIGSGQVYIGGAESGGGYFQGLLDDVRIYDTQGFSVHQARGLYYADGNTTYPVSQGEFWRIMIDGSGAVSSTTRLYAGYSDFVDMEINPSDPSQGWVIRQAYPARWPHGGRLLKRFTQWGENLESTTAELGSLNSDTFASVHANPSNADHLVLLCGGEIRDAVRYSLDGGVSWLGTDRSVGGHCPSIMGWTPSDHDTYGLGLRADERRQWASNNFSWVPGKTNEMIISVKWVLGGLMKSTDYGANLATYASGGPNKAMTQIAVSSTNPDHWSIGAKEYGVVVSQNAGQLWKGISHHNNDLFDDLGDIANPLPGVSWGDSRNMTGMAYDPGNPDHMIGSYSEVGNILKSVDAGVNWVDTGIKQPDTLYQNCLVFWSNVDPNRVYAGRLRSLDGGVSWEDMDKYIVTVSSSDPDLLIGSGDITVGVDAASLGLYRSVDGGESWTVLPEPAKEAVPGLSGAYWHVSGLRRTYSVPPLNLLSIDPLTSAGNLRILMAGRSGIYEYNEGSNDWTLRDTGLEPNIHFSAVEPVPWMGLVQFDPRPGYEHIVYASKSHNHQQLDRWAEGENLNHPVPGGLLTEPFYRSTDGGISWSKLHGASQPDAPEAVSMITSILVDTEGRFFASTAAGMYIYTHDETATTDKTIEFVAAEGYVNADLSGQQGWSGDAGVFSVNTNLPGTVTVSSNAWKKILYGAGSIGSKSVVGASFNFKEATVADATKIGFRLELVGADGTSAALGLQRKVSGSYQFNFAENSGDSSWLSGSVVLAASALGTANAAGSESDTIYFELSLEKGATSNDWKATVSAYNLTVDPNRSQPLDTYSVAFASSSEFFKGSLLPGVNSAAQLDANLSDVLVDSVYVKSETSAFSRWISGYGLFGSDAEQGADPDMDLLNNLSEYAFGGNPTNANDVGYVPTCGTEDGLFALRHVMRLDSGIDYSVEMTSNLVSGVWTTNDVTTVSGPMDSTFNMVTNAVSLDDRPQAYIRLTISGESE